MKLDIIAHNSLLLFVLLVNSATVFGIISRRSHPMLSSLFSTANRARGPRAHRIVPYRRSYSLYDATRYFNNFARKYDRGTKVGNDHGTHSVHSLAKAANLRGRHRPIICKHCQIFRRRNIVNPPPGLLFGSGVLPVGTTGDIIAGQHHHAVVKPHAKPVIPSEFHVHSDKRLTPLKVNDIAKAENSVIKQKTLNGKVLPPYKAMNQIPSSTLNDLINSPVSTLQHDYNFIYNVLDKHTPNAAVPQVTNLVPIKSIDTGTTSSKFGANNDIMSELSNVHSIAFSGNSIDVNNQLSGNRLGGIVPSPVHTADKSMFANGFSDGTAGFNSPSFLTTSQTSPGVEQMDMNNELQRPVVSLHVPAVQPNHPMQGVQQPTFHSNDVLQANVGAIGNPIDLVHPKNNEGTLLRNPSAIPSLDVIGDILKGDIHSMNSVDMQRFLPSLVPTGEHQANPIDSIQNISPSIPFRQSEMPFESVQPGFVPNTIAGGTELFPRGTHAGVSLENNPHINDNIIPNFGQAPNGFSVDSVIPPLMENRDMFRQQLPISGAGGNIEEVLPVDGRNTNDHLRQLSDNIASDISTDFANSDIPFNAPDGFISLGPVSNTIEGQQPIHMKESGVHVDVSGIDANNNVGGVSVDFVPSNIPLNSPDVFISFGPENNHIEGQHSIHTTNDGVAVDVSGTNPIVGSISADFVPSDILPNAADGFINLSPDSTTNLDHQQTEHVNEMSNSNNFDLSTSVNHEGAILNQNFDILTDANNFPNVDLTMQQRDQSRMNRDGFQELPLPPVELRAPFDETANQNLPPITNINENQISIEPRLPGFVSETVQSDPLVEIIPLGADLGINLPNVPGINDNANIDQTPSNMQISLIPELMEKHGSGIRQREPIGRNLENSVGGVPIDFERIDNQVVNNPEIQHHSDINIASDVSTEFLPTTTPLYTGNGFMNVVPEGNSNIEQLQTGQTQDASNINSLDKSNSIDTVVNIDIPNQHIDAKTDVQMVQNVDPSMPETSFLSNDSIFLDTTSTISENILSQTVTDTELTGHGDLNPTEPIVLMIVPEAETPDIFKSNELQKSHSSPDAPITANAASSVPSKISLKPSVEHSEINHHAEAHHTGLESSIGDTKQNVASANTLSTNPRHSETPSHIVAQDIHNILPQPVLDHSHPHIPTSPLDVSTDTADTKGHIDHSSQFGVHENSVNHGQIQLNFEDLISGGMDGPVINNEHPQSTVDFPTNELTVDHTDETKTPSHVVAHDMNNVLPQADVDHAHSHTPIVSIQDVTVKHKNTADAHGHIDHTSQFGVHENRANHGDTMLNFGDLISGGTSDAAINTEHPKSTIRFTGKEAPVEHTDVTKPMSMPESKTAHHASNEITHANGHGVHSDLHIASVHDQINQVPQEMAKHSPSIDGITLTKHQTSQIMDLLSGEILPNPTENQNNVHITADEVWSISFNTPIPPMVGSLETSHTSESHTTGVEASVPSSNNGDSPIKTFSSNPNHSEGIPHVNAHDIHNTMQQAGIDTGVQSGFEGINPSSDLSHVVDHNAGAIIMKPSETGPENTQNTITVITDEENNHGAGLIAGSHAIPQAVNPDIFTDQSFDMNRPSTQLHSILSPLSGSNGNKMVSTDIIRMLVNAELSPSGGIVQDSTTTKQVPIV